MANKTQDGRGTVTVTSIPLIYTLDLRALSEKQHDAAMKAFKKLAKERLLPFDQIDEDPIRAEIDRALLVDVLGLKDDFCKDGGPMDLLRQKLASEPQIRGNKRTKMTFTDEGEINIPR
jgi:hypothetical protein